MLGLHSTKDKRQLPIVSMSTTHIINYLNLSLRVIMEMVQQLNKKQSSLVSRLAKVKAPKITQEEIDELSIEFLEEKMPYIAELMRRALFLQDEKARLYVHKIFSQIGEELLTNMEGTNLPLSLPSPKKSSSQSKSNIFQQFREEEFDEDYVEYYPDDLHN